MDVPPSRYRVIEQGRRLVVIDTRTGRPAPSYAPPPPPAARPEQARLAPAASPSSANPGFVTSGLYDNKAPRTIALDQRNSRLAGSGIGLAIVVLIILGLFAWLMPASLIVVVALLANRGVRRALRAGVTKWLDGLIQDARASGG